jgi:addiction module RelE/StbE family toxin
MKMRILWAPLALERVTEIAQYIAQDNPVAAKNWVDTIFAKVDQLKSFSESGRVVPETGNQTIRELIYSNYRIIYRIEQNRLSILTVRHGKQILPEDDIL